ncbi:hypothetical protein ABZU32_30790 [Sphaerisporangium sp. NPDC005288]|uniref:hypothetical protein n=1 Tax=Sphaerisporangium sp. NPDC005288 TaxID=3155114 RepID=UPI0033AF3F5D
MTPESLLPETLREWSEEATVPPGLSDRALERRSRRRRGTVVLALAASAAVVAGAVLVPQTLSRGAGRPVPATGVTGSASPTGENGPEPTATTTAAVTERGLDVHADPRNSPPKTLIAAGRIAVSAYRIWAPEKIGPTSERRRDQWFLYDPGTGRYEETPWAALDVAPGMRFAAVLERDLPARRVGILDMTTREIVRWVDLDHPVADVSWSRDGAKVLATAYDRDPTIRFDVSADGTSWREPDPGRTGFQVVDVASGRASFIAVPPPGGSPYRPFAWADDGTLVWQFNPAFGEAGERRELVYDLEGRPHDPPAGPLETDQRAGVSPDGTMYASFGRPPGPETSVKKVATGELVGRQKMLQLLAWADDEHLIGLGCAGECRNEFNNGLVLVGIDGKHTVQLSGDRKNSERPGSWEPLLTVRR